MLTLSLTSIASTFTSVRSLRYVIYPVQVLFKSCKPVPVMLFNLVLGKRYKLVKYVNVIIITAGVGLFMGGGSSAHKGGDDPKSDTLLLGAIMLSVSLCFDGATGAYEDQLMSKNNVEPFDLMYNIQLGKAVISFCVLVATNGLNEFMHTIEAGGFSLVILGLTGALGQVFVFVTISKFGALNCALIGLGRKILSLVLSFVLYGHTMNAFQTVGLALAITAMIANFYEKVRSLICLCFLPYFALISLSITSPDQHAPRCILFLLSSTLPEHCCLFFVRRVATREDTATAGTEPPREPPTRTP